MVQGLRKDPRKGKAARRGHRRLRTIAGALIPELGAKAACSPPRRTRFAIAIDYAEHFLVIEHARPGDEFARAGQLELAMKIRDLPLILAPVTQSGKTLTHSDQGRNAYVGRRTWIEAMTSRRAERSKARKIDVNAGLARFKPGSTCTARMLGSKHRLTQIPVRIRVPRIEAWQKLADPPSPVQRSPVPCRNKCREWRG